MLGVAPKSRSSPLPTVCGLCCHSRVPVRRLTANVDSTGRVVAVVDTSCGLLQLPVPNTTTPLLTPPVTSTDGDDHTSPQPCSLGWGSSAATPWQLAPS